MHIIMQPRKARKRRRRLGDVPADVNHADYKAGGDLLEKQVAILRAYTDIGAERAEYVFDLRSRAKSATSLTMAQQLALDFIESSFITGRNRVADGVNREVCRLLWVLPSCDDRHRQLHNSFVDAAAIHQWCRPGGVLDQHGVRVIPVTLDRHRMRSFDMIAVRQFHLGHKTRRQAEALTDRPALTDKQRAVLKLLRVKRATRTERAVSATTIVSGVDGLRLRTLQRWSAAGGPLHAHGVRGGSGRTGGYWLE